MVAVIEQGFVAIGNSEDFDAQHLNFFKTVWNRSGLPNSDLLTDRIDQFIFGPDQFQIEVTIPSVSPEPSRILRLAYQGDQRFVREPSSPFESGSIRLGGPGEIVNLSEDWPATAVESLLEVQGQTYAVDALVDRRTIKLFDHSIRVRRGESFRLLHRVAVRRRFWRLVDCRQPAKEKHVRVIPSSRLAVLREKLKSAFDGALLSLLDLESQSDGAILFVVRWKEDPDFRLEPNSIHAAEELIKPGFTIQFDTLNGTRWTPSRLSVSGETYTFTSEPPEQFREALGSGDEQVQFYWVRQSASEFEFSVEELDVTTRLVETTSKAANRDLAIWQFAASELTVAAIPESRRQSPGNWIGYDLQSLDRFPRLPKPVNRRIQGLDRPFQIEVDASLRATNGLAGWKLEIDLLRPQAEVDASLLELTVQLVNAGGSSSSPHYIESMRWKAPAESVFLVAQSPDAQFYSQSLSEPTSVPPIAQPLDALAPHALVFESQQRSFAVSGGIYARWNGSLRSIGGFELSAKAMADGRSALRLYRGFGRALVRPVSHAAANLSPPLEQEGAQYSLLRDPTRGLTEVQLTEGFEIKFPGIGDLANPHGTVVASQISILPDAAALALFPWAEIGFGDERSVVSPAPETGSGVTRSIHHRNLLLELLEILAGVKGRSDSGRGTVEISPAARERLIRDRETLMASLDPSTQTSEVGNWGLNATVENGLPEIEFREFEGRTNPTSFEDRPFAKISHSSLEDQLFHVLYEGDPSLDSEPRVLNFDITWENSVGAFPQFRLDEWSYSEGTVSVSAGGVVLLSGGTWPGWASEAILEVAGQFLPVQSRQSGGQLTVTPPTNSIAGESYRLHASPVDRHYDEGTIVVQGASVELTGGVWPYWAEQGSLEFGGLPPFAVESRVDDSNLTIEDRGVTESDIPFRLTRSTVRAHSSHMPLVLSPVSEVDNPRYYDASGIVRLSDPVEVRSKDSLFILDSIWVNDPINGPREVSVLHCDQLVIRDPALGNDVYLYCSELKGTISKSSTRWTFTPLDPHESNDAAILSQIGKGKWSIHRSAESTTDRDSDDWPTVDGVAVFPVSLQSVVFDLAVQNTASIVELKVGAVLPSPRDIAKPSHADPPIFVERALELDTPAIINFVLSIGQSFTYAANGVVDWYFYKEPPEVPEAETADQLVRIVGGVTNSLRQIAVSSQSVSFLEQVIANNDLVDLFLDYDGRRICYETIESSDTWMSICSENGRQPRFSIPFAVPTEPGSDIIVSVSARDTGFSGALEFKTRATLRFDHILRTAERSTVVGIYYGFELEDQAGCLIVWIEPTQDPRRPFQIAWRLVEDTEFIPQAEARFEGVSLSGPRVGLQVRSYDGANRQFVTWSLRTNSNVDRWAPWSGMELLISSQEFPSSGKTNRVLAHLGLTHLNRTGSSNDRAFQGSVVLQVPFLDDLSDQVVPIRIVDGVLACRPVAPLASGEDTGVDDVLFPSADGTRRSIDVRKSVSALPTSADSNEPQPSLAKLHLYLNTVFQFDASSIGLRLSTLKYFDISCDGSKLLAVHTGSWHDHFHYWDVASGTHQTVTGSPTEWIPIEARFVGGDHILVAGLHSDHCHLFSWDGSSNYELVPNGVGVVFGMDRSRSSDATLQTWSSLRSSDDKSKEWAFDPDVPSLAEVATGDITTSSLHRDVLLTKAFAFPESVNHIGSFILLSDAFQNRLDYYLSLRSDGGATIAFESGYFDFSYSDDHPHAVLADAAGLVVAMATPRNEIQLFRAFLDGMTPKLGRVATIDTSAYDVSEMSVSLASWQGDVILALGQASGLIEIHRLGELSIGDDIEILLDVPILREERRCDHLQLFVVEPEDLPQRLWLLTTDETARVIDLSSINFDFCRLDRPVPPLIRCLEGDDARLLPTRMREVPQLLDRQGEGARLLAGWHRIPGQVQASASSTPLVNSDWLFGPLLDSSQRLQPYISNTWLPWPPPADIPSDQAPRLKTVSLMTMSREVDLGVIYNQTALNEATIGTEVRHGGTNELLRRIAWEGPVIRREFNDLESPKVKFTFVDNPNSGSGGKPRLTRGARRTMAVNAKLDTRRISKREAVSSGLLADTERNTRFRPANDVDIENRPATAPGDSQMVRGVAVRRGASTSLGHGTTPDPIPRPQAIQLELARATENVETITGIANPRGNSIGRGRSYIPENIRLAFGSTGPGSTLWHRVQLARLGESYQQAPTLMFSMKDPQQLASLELGRVQITKATKHSVELETVTLTGLSQLSVEWEETLGPLAIDLPGMRLPDIQNRRFIEKLEEEYVLHSNRRLFATVVEIDCELFEFPKFDLLEDQPTYDTGTVAIFNGLVALTGGEWPVWASDAEITVAGMTYSVKKLVSQSQLRLEDDTVNITGPANYVLTGSKYEIQPNSTLPLQLFNSEASSLLPKLMLVTRIQDLDQPVTVFGEATQFEPVVTMTYRTTGSGTKTRQFAFGEVFRLVNGGLAGYFIWKPRSDFDRDGLWQNLLQLNIAWWNEDAMVSLSPWQTSDLDGSTAFNGIQTRIQNSALGATVAVVATRSSGEFFSDETLLFGASAQSSRATPRLRGAPESVDLELVSAERASVLAQLPVITTGEVQRVHVVKSLPNGQLIADRRNVMS